MTISAADIYSAGKKNVFKKVKLCLQPKKKTYIQKEY